MRLDAFLEPPKRGRFRGKRVAGIGTVQVRIKRRLLRIEGVMACSGIGNDAGIVRVLIDRRPTTYPDTLRKSGDHRMTNAHRVVGDRLVEIRARGVVLLDKAFAPVVRGSFVKVESRAEPAIGVV